MEAWWLTSSVGPPKAATSAVLQQGFLEDRTDQQWDLRQVPPPGACVEECDKSAGLIGLTGDNP